MNTLQKAAIIYDKIQTALVYCTIWRECVPDLVKLLENYKNDVGQPPLDTCDTACVDVVGVLLLHLKAGGMDARNYLPDAHQKINVLQDLKDYEILCKKISHGCMDMSCSICEKELFGIGC